MELGKTFGTLVWLGACNPGTEDVPAPPPPPVEVAVEDKVPVEDKDEAFVTREAPEEFSQEEIAAATERRIERALGSCPQAEDGTRVAGKNTIALGVVDCEDWDPKDKRIDAVRREGGYYDSCVSIPDGRFMWVDDETSCQEALQASGNEEK